MIQQIYKYESVAVGKSWCFSSIRYDKIANIGNVNPGMVAVGERDWNFGGKGSHWVPQLSELESISWHAQKFPDGLLVDLGTI